MNTTKERLDLISSMHWQKTGTTFFLQGQLSDVSWSQILRFIFPMVMIVTGMDSSWVQLYIFFWSVHFAALLLTTVLLLYHINLVIHGKICIARNRVLFFLNSFDFDFSNNVDFPFYNNLDYTLFNDFELVLRSFFCWLFYFTILHNLNFA